MIDGPHLAKAFDRNRRIIHAQVEGLGHHESLLQTPYNINCLNWVIGHILDGRNQLLPALGEEPVVDEGRLARYRRESDPITGDGPGVVELEHLMAALDACQERFDRAMAALSGTDLSTMSDLYGRAASLAERIHFAYFHDTYHTGQTELLRQVAGTDDKII